MYELHVRAIRSHEYSSLPLSKVDYKFVAAFGLFFFFFPYTNAPKVGKERKIVTQLQKRSGLGKKKKIVPKVFSSGF